MEIDLLNNIVAGKKGKAPLNKPFRLPSGSKKKFGVYVKNDKGNIVKVTFGDPNMSIKRDNPERRKAYRARHGCDNPGPKWKANYWSCKMWSAKPVSKITGSNDECRCGCAEEDEQKETNLEVDIQAKNKGLWYNIQQKKKRMGKNYKPAKPGSKDYPDKKAFKKAQAEDYFNEEYEWDAETEFDQTELLKLDPSLAQVAELPDDPEEMKYHIEDTADMALAQFEGIRDSAIEIIEMIKNNPQAALEITEGWVTNKITLIEDYIITVKDYIKYPLEEMQAKNLKTKEDDKTIK
jgi:hypothetical protein